jgi:hypothetical protein
MSSPQLTVTADGGKIPSSLRIAFVPVAIGLNLAIGTLAHALRLPLYLDAIGTIIATLLLGWRAGILTGVGSFLLAGLITNPVLPWFSVQGLYSGTPQWARLRRGSGNRQRASHCLSFRWNYRQWSLCDCGIFIINRSHFVEVGVHVWTCM